MRKAVFFIVLCWAAFGFFLYLGYSESYGLPQFDLPIEYAYLPEALRTQESAIILLISGLLMGLVSYAVVARPRAVPIFIFVCWIVFVFLLYLGYGDTYGLPQIDLPIGYEHLPEVLSTQTSAIAFLISGLFLGLVSYAIIFQTRGNISGKVGKIGSKYRSGARANTSRTKRTKEYYTNPGTYEIREARPHKYQERKPPTKKSWEKELYNWVKKRRK